MADVRPELLESPWDEEDGVIREYLFAHDATLKQKMEVWEFQNDPVNLCIAAPPCCLPLSAICVPIQYAYYNMNHDMQYQNLIEELYARRLAVTKDGIVYKTLRKKPTAFDPTNPCAACCCAIGRFKDNEIGASSKVIPFDRVQDVRTEQAAGGTRRIIQAGGCYPYEQGDMIADVDASCDVDTAGYGIVPELMVPGLANAPNFRTTVLALKHGRELPPLDDGVIEGTADPSALQGPPPRASMKRASSSAKIMRYNAAPDSMEMTRTTEEQTTLLRSIDEKLAALVAIANRAVTQRACSA